VVQGWSTSYATSAHRNRIVPHRVGAVFQGNVLVVCNVHGLPPSGQVEKGCFQLHNQVQEKWIEPMRSIVPCP
jgi:hypothetical protein